jgi:DNA-binding SARP family transcriptional activator/tetratricopeptide (TPR) repeat protein
VHQMRIRLFGPVELVAADGRVVDVRAAKRRTVLATLALELNRVVSGDQLIDIAWESKPPPSARAALQGHIAQLRKVLGDGVELATRSSGYQLLADRSLVDVSRFDDLVTQAKAVPDTDAVELLRTALGLWRGPALADVPVDRLRERAAGRLGETRLVAVQELAERLHRLGRAAEVVDQLRDLVERYPLREPLVGLLVRGLHETGRQAEALQLYHRTRALLADELGVDPGGNLRQAYHLVLAGTGEAPLVATVPAQLPRENRGLVGRDAELAEVSTSLHEPDRAIRLLVGPAGAGKTALALHWAHRVAGQLPDGQLFVDLKGFDEAEPVDPTVALAGFLRALGVPDAQRPDDVHEQAALYRSLLAGRRMLIVLDNARTAEQVRPLLPGTPSCVVLVTSRHRLDDLVVTEGAVTVRVGTLAAGDAATVLGLVAGAARVAAEPEAAAELVELCDRLPLVLRIAAGRLAARPQWTLRAMVGELSDERGRLSALSLPDTGVAVHAALRLSYRTLTGESARLLRLLGHHPGPDIDQYAAAALAGMPVSEARAHLESLAAVHLVHETERGQYGRHALVRLFTAKMADEQPRRDSDLAIARLLDYYLRGAETARPLLCDHVCATDVPAVEHPPAELPRLDTVAAAAKWFDTEEANLHRVLDLAVARGHPGRVSKSPSATAGPDAVPDATAGTPEDNQYSRRPADGARNRTAVPFRPPAGASSHRTGTSGHDLERAWRLALCLESFHFRRGDLTEQLAVCQTGLAASQTLGNAEAQSMFLTMIGATLVKFGRAAESVRYCETAAGIGRPYRHARSAALISLGTALTAVGRLDEAADRLREALVIAREVDDIALQAYALNSDANVMIARNRPRDALRRVQQAMDLFAHGQRSKVYGSVLYTAGRVLSLLACPHIALVLLYQGLSVANDLGDRYLNAMHHRLIGDVLEHMDGETAAAPHWARAEKQYAALGLPGVHELRERLARSGSI